MISSGYVYVASGATVQLGQELDSASVMIVQVFASGAEVRLGDATAQEFPVVGGPNSSVTLPLPGGAGLYVKTASANGVNVAFIQIPQ